MRPERSVSGKKAKSVFFRKFNDIDIYVEDTACGSKKFYEILLQRVFDYCRVKNVFPIGCKQSVLAQCISDQNPGGRKRLYIVDGDLELLTNSNPSGYSRLVVLDSYCIENYLVDENAFVTALHEYDLEDNVATIKRKLSFKAFISKFEKDLFTIFVLYAAVKRISPSTATVAYSVHHLEPSRDGTPDRELLKDRQSEMQKILFGKINKSHTKKTVREIKYYCKGLNRQPIDFVSAKDYILPLLFMRMRYITSNCPRNSIIKQRLAFLCDISRLKVIIESVLLT
ncbi:DUF4435 domain-containing protein [Acidithiobacillus ferriphilus]|jgi:hypothetical protein|uniref:DUF4435 domain-containing protein n=1 Tax=Acidithiobacillus ferriphilus TaxID=1689834 RepID=UPI001C06E9C9|nr:DUF4435 domain-containing protein [Acidithiobacillus ferriphilus]MBU2844414.1 DUF4435 domain-containing protein [Acidithiobacillus ferriphilus]